MDQIELSRYYSLVGKFPKSAAHVYVKLRNHPKTSNFTTKVDRLNTNHPVTGTTFLLLRWPTFSITSLVSQTNWSLIWLDLFCQCLLKSSFLFKSSNGCFHISSKTPWILITGQAGWQRDDVRNRVRETKHLAQREHEVGGPTKLGGFGTNIYGTTVYTWYTHTCSNKCFACFATSCKKKI